MRLAGSLALDGAPRRGLSTADRLKVSNCRISCRSARRPAQAHAVPDLSRDMASPRGGCVAGRSKHAPRGSAVGSHAPHLHERENALQLPDCFGAVVTPDRVEQRFLDCLTRSVARVHAEEEPATGVVVIAPPF